MFAQKDFSADWAQHLAEEVPVKASKLQEEIYKTKRRHQEAQLKFFRPRRHGKQEEAKIFN